MTDPFVPHPPRHTSPQPAPSHWPFSWTPVTSDQFAQAATHIDRRLAAIEKTLQVIGAEQLSTQADVDALTTAVTDLQTKLTADDGQLLSGIAAVQAALAALPASVDTTALSAAVNSLSAGVDQIGVDAGNVVALVPPATS